MTKHTSWEEELEKLASYFDDYGEIIAINRKKLKQFISKLLSEQKKEIIEEVYDNLVKITDPKFGWVRMSRVANLLLSFNNDIKKAEKKWREMERNGEKWKKNIDV